MKLLNKFIEIIIVAILAVIATFLSLFVNTLPEPCFLRDDIPCIGGIFVEFSRGWPFAFYQRVNAETSIYYESFFVDFLFYFVLIFLLWILVKFLFNKLARPK
jgi:hypothetical protein